MICRYDSEELIVLQVVLEKVQNKKSHHQSNLKSTTKVTCKDKHIFLVEAKIITF